MQIQSYIGGQTLIGFDELHLAGGQLVDWLASPYDIWTGLYIEQRRIIDQWLIFKISFWTALITKIVESIHSFIHS